MYMLKRIAARTDPCAIDVSRLNVCEVECPTLVVAMRW